jgi:hypothetical protein
VFRLFFVFVLFWFATGIFLGFWFLRSRMLRIVFRGRGRRVFRSVCSVCGRFCGRVCRRMVCLFPLGCHLGGGEIRTTLSPRTIMSPSFLVFSRFVVSSVSSRTRFRCWSNPFKRPLRLFPPFKRTRTILPRFCSRISVVISLI